MVPPGLLLFVGNFHVNGKIENVNKSCFSNPREDSIFTPNSGVFCESCQFREAFSVRFPAHLSLHGGCCHIHNRISAPLPIA